MSQPRLPLINDCSLTRLTPVLKTWLHTLLLDPLICDVIILHLVLNVVGWESRPAHISQDFPSTITRKPSSCAQCRGVGESTGSHQPGLTFYHCRNLHQPECLTCSTIILGGWLRGRVGMCNTPCWQWPEHVSLDTNVSVTPRTRGSGYHKEWIHIRDKTKGRRGRGYLEAGADSQLEVFIYLSAYFMGEWRQGVGISCVTYPVDSDQNMCPWILMLVLPQGPEAPGITKYEYT